MRADRLVATLLLLQTRGRVTAADVATELEVSERTARRDLADALFGADPVAAPVVAVAGDQPVGFALYYAGCSTVLGRRGLHLEDLYVRAGHRGAGVGALLLAHLARLAVQQGCGRLEWWVLRTGDPALRSYRRLHARGLDEIEVMRPGGEALQALAAQAAPEDGTGGPPP